MLGGLILYGALFLIIFHLSYVSLLMYAVAIAIGYPLLLVPYVSLTYDVIGHARYARKARIEYIVVRELFLNAGRICSIVLFLLSVTLLGDELGIPASLVVLGAGHTLIYYFVKDIHLKEKTADMKETDGQKPVSHTNLIKGER